MRFWIFLVIACRVCARVTFKQSEVLDNVDLQDTYKADFRCSTGCRIFSPTNSVTIAIHDEEGKQITSLSKLSEDSKGVELPGGKYHLKIAGTIIMYESFVFYAVEKGAANYNSTVTYLNESMSLTVNADVAGPVTFLSSTGFVHINYAPSDKDVIVKVHATGFDSIDDCIPVYTSSSTSTSASFPVNSPIATISMNKKGTGKLMEVTGEKTPSKLAEGTSAVYITPGFVGCPDIVGDSLYTFDWEDSYLNDNFFTSHTKARLSVAINGYASIKKWTGYVHLRVNNEYMALWGKNRTISKTYEDTTFVIEISWTLLAPGPDWLEEKKDNFAIQIDVEPKPGKSTGSIFRTVLGMAEVSMPISMEQFATGSFILMLILFIILFIAKKITCNTYTSVL